MCMYGMYGTYCTRPKTKRQQIIIIIKNEEENVCCILDS